MSQNKAQEYLKKYKNKEGHESKNVVASRCWKQPSIYSHQKSGDLGLHLHLLNYANNMNEQEMDFLLERDTICQLCDLVQWDLCWILTYKTVRQ